MANIYKFSDLDLNFSPHPVTGDIVRVFDDLDIKQAVKNLILMRRFEAPFQPEKGSGVWSLLFEPCSFTTALELKANITEVLNNYEPRIQLIDVAVIVRPDERSYNITIVYNIINRPERYDLTFTLDRIG